MATSKTKAFTLIELLIVIAIIGILATISVMSFGNVQAKARDSQRKTDLSKISAAMELYKADKKAYPNTKVSGSTTWMTVEDPAFCSQLTGGNYISSIPKNPKGSQPYMIMSTGTSYKIVVTSETVPYKPGTEAEARRLAGEYFERANSSCLQVTTDISTANWRPGTSLGYGQFCQKFVN